MKRNIYISSHCDTVSLVNFALTTFIVEIWGIEDSCKTMSIGESCVNFPHKRNLSIDKNMFFQAFKEIISWLCANIVKADVFILHYFRTAAILVSNLVMGSYGVQVL